MINRRLFLISTAIFATFLFAIDAAADIEAATVVFASGEVQVVDVDSRRRFVIKGDLVWPKETLVTAEGRVQVRFSDGGRVSLKPNTIYNITDYYYAESTNEPVKSFFELVRGSVRFVSGAIAKRNRANFAIKTKTATIGIRGSSGLVTSCLGGSCRGRLDGTYLTTYAGILTMFSGDSVIEIHPNESGFCADDGSGCTKLDQTLNDPQVDPFGGIEPGYQEGNQIQEDHHHSEPVGPPPSLTPPHTNGGGYRY